MEEHFVIYNQRVMLWSFRSTAIFPHHYDYGLTVCHSTCLWRNVFIHLFMYGIVEASHMHSLTVTDLLFHSDKDRKIPQYQSLPPPSSYCSTPLMVPRLPWSCSWKVNALPHELFIWPQKGKYLYKDGFHRLRFDYTTNPLRNNTVVLNSVLLT